MNCRLKKVESDAEIRRNINKPSTEDKQFHPTKEEAVAQSATAVLSTPPASTIFQTEEKKGKRQKRDKARYSQKQYIKAGQCFKVLLDSKKIPNKAQVSFTREETTKEGLPKVYIADSVVNNLIFELEGPGTSSDSIERDMFFKKNNYYVVHIPNELAIKHGNVLIELIDTLYHKLDTRVPIG